MSEELEAGKARARSHSQIERGIASAPASSMAGERTEGVREVPCRALKPPAVDGTEVNSLLRGSPCSLRALDHAAVGWAYAFESMGFNILTIISASALLSVDQDCFEGLFGVWSENRARRREWLPRLQPLTIVSQGEN